MRASPSKPQILSSAIRRLAKVYDTFDTTFNIFSVPAFLIKPESVSENVQPRRIRLSS